MPVSDSVTLVCPGFSFAEDERGEVGRGAPPRREAKEAKSTVVRVGEDGRTRVTCTAPRDHEEKIASAIASNEILRSTS